MDDTPKIHGQKVAGNFRRTANEYRMRYAMRLLNLNARSGWQNHVYEYIESHVFMRGNTYEEPNGDNLRYLLPLSYVSGLYLKKITR